MFIGNQKWLFNFSFLLLSPPFSPTLTHIVLSFLAYSSHHLFPSVVVVPPPLSVRQILFKRLSCSLMVKTLANRYLHTWQNAGGQGRERQGARERAQVRERGKKKNNKLTTRRPLFPLAEMDGSAWMSVRFFSAPSCFICPLSPSVQGSGNAYIPSF